MIASEQWKMRTTKEEKKMIANAAKHFHCKQTKLVKALVYALDKAITEGKIKHLSPAA